jgi:hypothetical protein
LRRLFQDFGWRRRRLRYFELVVDDDRPEIAPERVLVAGDLFLAVVRAQQLTNDSFHYRGVVVWESGRRLFGIGSCASAPRET